MPISLPFDEGCVALWALSRFDMIPVAYATGRDISPSGLATAAACVPYCR